MSSRWTDDIEALLEWLGSLQITEEASSNDTWTDTKISETLAMNKNIQAVIPKSMVLDLGWFDSDQMKFEDW